MRNIKAVLGASQCPLFLFINDKETASDAVIKARYFKESKSGVGFVTNLEKAFSITEESDAAEVNKELVNEITVNELTELQRMQDSEGNTVYTDPELAFDLVSLKEPFRSPLSGKPITLDYANEDEEDTSETDDESEEEEDDTSEEEETTEDDTMSGDEDTSDEDESEEEDDTMLTDLDDVEEDSEDESEDDESEEEEEEDSDEEEASEEEPKPEETQEQVVQEAVEVSMLDLIDPSKTLRVVALGGNEMACFVGTQHIGNLKQTEAVETAAFLYADGQKLFRTFKDRWLHCSKTANYDELASLGFVPANVKVNINDLTMRTITKMVSEEVEKASVDQSAYKQRVNKLLSLSIVGIAKGVFVKDNPLTKEIATVLSRSGVQNANGQARRILAKAAQGFSEAVVEQATELETKTDAYLNGVTETVSKADFKSTDEETSDLGLLSTSFGAPAAQEEDKSEVASFVPDNTKRIGKPTGEKFRGLFARR